MRNIKLMDIGEFKLIEHIKKLCRCPMGVTGIGDDAAVFEVGIKNILVTTDIFIEGVHFLHNFIKVKDLGWRVSAASISDIAAMGGIPMYMCIAIGISKNKNVKFVEGIYKGIIECNKKFNVSIIGGDTVASKTTVISITVIGYVEKRRLKLRSGARVGDSIFVTGKLGYAALGLDILKNKIRIENNRNYIKKFLNPVPKIKIGRKLSKLSYVNAMIDLSDGLLSDLKHITISSNVGAEIYEEDIPIAKNLEKNKALQYAISGGEDYELLFTASSKNFNSFKKFYKIGKILPAKEGIIFLSKYGNKKKVKNSGYEHFRS